VYDIAASEVKSLDLSHLLVNKQSRLIDVLLKNKNVFSLKPGVCNLNEHHIKLRNDFKPRAQTPYRIPMKLQLEVDKQIDQLLADGKITPANNQYAHPIVCVTKPNGEIRLCCDFCDLI